MSNSPPRGRRLTYCTELRNGDCLVQREFHRLYESMPEDFKAELIGGTVFVNEPLGVSHGDHHMRLGSIFDAYQASTPGTHGSDNATVILGEDDEVQPDLFLRVLPEYKGQSRNTKPVGKAPNIKGPYVEGAPELVAEIAYSSRAIDLHLKRQRYLHTGVIEYVVLCLSPLQIVWFDLRNGRMIEPDDAAVFRSIIFPGLWIHADALLTLDYRLSMDVLARGIASPEHAEFVAFLATKRGL